jgi:uncharacterized protein
MKIFFLISLLIVSFIVIKLFKRRITQYRLERNKHKNIGNIKKCHVCGLHIPENQATINRGKFYCCLEHANQDKLPPAV